MMHDELYYTTTILDAFQELFLLTVNHNRTRPSTRAELLMKHNSVIYLCFF